MVSSPCRLGFIRNIQGAGCRVQDLGFRVVHPLFGTSNKGPPLLCNSQKGASTCGARRLPVPSDGLLAGNGTAAACA